MVPDLDAETPTPAEPEAGREINEIPEDQEIDFVTLGMFIIDEIQFPPPQPPIRDVLGGAATYSALGARLFSPPPLSKSVGWIVDQGSDFPPSLTTSIDSWQTSVLFRHDPSRLTTRGWNGYTSADTQHRAFRYTTPKKRLTAADLTPPLLQAKAVHLICSPLRCQELTASLLALRKQAFLADPANNDSLDNYARPLIIWEPVPDLCTPDQLLNCTNTLPLVDVCSPNHTELAGFMGSDGLDPETGAISRAAVESSCEQLLASMPLQSYTLVVRAGREGCYIARNGGRKKNSKRGAGAGGARRKKKEYVRGGLRPDTDMEALFAGLMQDEEGHVAREEIEVDPGVEKWVRAYYDGSDGIGKGEEGDGGGGKVVDPTGGGNTFLGALAVALARGKSIEEACAWGNVAASFAIEQVGFPVLAVDAEGRETWNGVRVEERLREFQERL
ncbi:Protein MAK32 [Madurella mycetomatis]|uniref:Protein MAK32 n=1 Tax=Madurella mycetomatis TaxID=100816 RepID=A0A150ASR9_9PEZI|nr:Protein MAK32 [Madurella mycetomatis]